MILKRMILMIEDKHRSKRNSEQKSLSVPSQVIWNLVLSDPLIKK